MKNTLVEVLDFLDDMALSNATVNTAIFELYKVWNNCKNNLQNSKIPQKNTNKLQRWKWCQTLMMWQWYRILW